MALRKWATYIALHQVTVCTDHQSLQLWHREHVDIPSAPDYRRARWHETLVNFNLTVVYIHGKVNTRTAAHGIPVVIPVVVWLLWLSH